MGYDLGRAALACLSILAVVFAASLFPAAGLGTYPGDIGAMGSGPGSGSSGPGSSGGPSDGGGSTATPTTTADASGSDPGDTSTTATAGAGEGTTSGADGATATRTATETASAGADGDDGAGEGGTSDDGADGTLPSVAAVVVFFLIAVPSVVAFLLTVGMVGGIVVPHRRGPNGRLVLSIFGREIDVGGSLQGLSRATMGYVLGLSSSSARLLDGIGDAVRGLSGGLASLGTGGTKALVAVPAALGRGLAGVGRGLGTALIAVPSGFGTLFSGIGSFSLGWSGGATPTRDARSGGGSTSSDEGSGPGYQPPQSVEEAWDRFTDQIRVRNPDARTPGEFARVAAGRGLPSDAVGRLTETFREVRYGDRSPSGERFERAREAYQRVRDHRTEDDE